MGKIDIILTAYNMGAECDEADFDAWAEYVANEIAEALGIEWHRIEIEQHDYKNGPAQDTVTGGTDGEREKIREWLSHEGWEAFCAAAEAWPARA